MRDDMRDEQRCLVLRGRRSPWTLGAAIGFLLSLLGVNAIVEAHEPIFGIGPHTIHQYGIGLEAEFEGDGDEREIGMEVIYGITEDIAVTASLPYRTKGETGLANLLLRSKWRFYRRDGRGGSNQAALAFGIRTPGIQRGPDSFGYLFALTAGREARREYFFSGIRYMWNTSDKSGAKPGDVFKYDIAGGIRPITAEYGAPDLVILLELNGTYVRQTGLPSSVGTDPGTERSGSGNKIGIGPGLLFTYKNIMLKAGLDLILIRGSKRLSLGDETAFVFALESHLSPFSFLYGK